MQDPGRQRLRHAHHHLAVRRSRQEEGGCYLGQVRRHCNRAGIGPARKEGGDSRRDCQHRLLQNRTPTENRERQAEIQRSIRKSDAVILTEVGVECTISPYKKSSLAPHSCFYCRCPVMYRQSYVNVRVPSAAESLPCNHAVHSRCCSKALPCCSRSGSAVVGAMVGIWAIIPSFSLAVVSSCILCRAKQLLVTDSYM